MKLFMRLLLLLAVGVAVCPMEETAAAEPGSLADSAYTAIDLTYITLPSPSGDRKDDGFLSGRGIEPSPWYIGRQQGIFGYHVTILTLDGITGGQLGDRLVVPFPETKTPADILAAVHFAYNLGKGVDPVPWIVFRDLTLYTFPVTFGSDGTPSAGTPVTINLGLSPTTYGNATSLAELPGTEFIDGKDRLFIGTDLGYIVVVINTMAAGIIVDDIFPAAISPGQILDLQPIPQYEYLAMGALINNQIFGFHYLPVLKRETERLAAVFYLQNPSSTPMTGFDTFGPHDVPLTRPDTTIGLVFADGTEILELASVSATASGVQVMETKSDPADAAITSVIAGSLLMLLQDESDILFDPEYSADSGASPCNVNITDTVSDVCGYICGDANGDGAVNVGDAVYIVNYVFRGGPAPVPMQAGDATGDGNVNVGDAVYIINFVFRGGPAPICP